MTNINEQIQELKEVAAQIVTGKHYGRGYVELC